MTTGDSAPIESFIASLRPVGIDTDLVRLGSAAGDGGYVVPDDLDGALVAISPGVAQEVSFDSELASRGIDVVMLDASVPGPPTTNPRFTFLPLFLDSYSSATTTTIADLMSTYCPEDSDVILEMDIEGAEYRVIHSLSESALKRFRMLIVEFHDLHELMSATRRADIISAFEKILKTHRVVHAHANNCSPGFKVGSTDFAEVMEFTFHRRDRAREDRSRDPEVPHPLDRECAPGNPSLAMPASWRKV